MDGIDCTDENKVEIRLLGGLPAIVGCLESGDVRARRDALRTVCNLSIDRTFSVMGRCVSDVCLGGGARVRMRCPLRVIALC